MAVRQERAERTENSMENGEANQPMGITDAETTDMSLLERVNPVYNTAKMALCGLAWAGDGDATAICEKLKINSAPKAGGKAEPDAGDPLAAIQNLANAVFLEIRFRTVGVMAEKEGSAGSADGFTIVDLPCGYTPRGLQISQKNRRYIGLDLPATISEMEQVVMPLVRDEKKAFVRYAAVDATNYASLESALEGITGPLCITTEGLLMYFNDSETAAMCENIYRLLSKYGGCWITSDPEMMIQNMLVMRAIAGERYQEVMNNLMRGFESKADIHVETPVMMIQPWKNGGKDMEADRERALAFLAGKGLQAERLTVGRYMPEIRSFSALEPEVAETVRAGMEQCTYWKITLKPTEKKDRTDEITAEDFAVRAALTEGRLDLSLTGRVDTLTAPRVLELYEKISEDAAITGIVVDCSKLQYISSAGLRVLLIMQKKHGVKLVAVNSVVMEILETTGFDSILEVEE